MDEQAVMTRVTDIFRETLDDEDLELQSTTSASDVEEWDSVAHVQLMVAIELSFGIRISTGEVASLKDVGELVHLIAQRIGT
jgi:acyl carrier protein